MRPREVARDVAAGTLAGIAVGVLVGGLGSRLVMRISAVAAGPLSDGLRTSNGNIVGEITFGGTLALLVFTGAFSGLFGGLLYGALRPWLEPLGRWRGLVFGLGLLAFVGTLVIEPENIDFILLPPAALNIAMFAAIFPVFGMALAPAVDRLSRTLANGSSAGALLTGVGILLAAFFIVAAVITNRVALGLDPSRSDLLILAATSIIVAAIAIRLVGADVRWSSPAGRIGYAALAAAVLFGAVQTISGIATILTF